MDKERISVLVVDDSALMRNLIGRIVEHNPDLRLAGTAMNGMFALQKIPRLDPDVVILDLAMPEMNGLEFLKERRRLGLRVPVIILSSLARKGAQITMEALDQGAADFIQKPSGAVSEDIHKVADVLLEMIRAYGGAYHLQRTGIVPQRAEIPPEHRPDLSARPGARARVIPVREPGSVEIVAIGISTGGPNALREVFAGLDADLPAPVVVVQHMPAGFTEEFAKSLNRICRLEVKEAAEGDVLKPGRILIAPGNRHMIVENRSLATIVRILDNAPVNGHRPSVDVLFESIARSFGNRSLGIIMTGMGRDGAQRIGDIYREGGLTIGQDEASSIVYGMPRAAWENGFLRQQLSLSEMAAAINRLSKERR